MQSEGWQPYEEDTSLFDWALVWNVFLFVLRAPTRHKAVASLSFLSVASMSVIAIYLVPFKYRADAGVLARPNPLMGALSTGVNRELDTPTRFAREAILKRENLKVLVQDTHLVSRALQERPALVRAKHALVAALTGHEPTLSQMEEGMVETLEDRLIIDVNNDTVSFSFQWWDPGIAFEVVQGAVKNFLNVRHTSEITTIGEAIATLEGHRARLESDIDDRIAELESYQAMERSKKKPDGRPALVAGPPRSDRDLMRLESTLAARKQAVTDLESFRQQRIAQVRAELMQQESTYAADHPTLASTRRVLATLNEPSPQVQELAAEIDKLEREVQQKRGSSSSSSSSAFAIAQLGGLRDQYADQAPRSNFEWRQLELLLDQYWHLMGRINQSRLEMETAQATFNDRYSVISPPTVPDRPMKPYGLLFLFGGITGGIAFALFSTTVLDLRRGVVLERWQVEKRLALPVIAEIRRP